MCIAGWIICSRIVQLLYKSLVSSPLRRGSSRGSFLTAFQVIHHANATPHSVCCVAVLAQNSSFPAQAGHARFRVCVCTTRARLQRTSIAHRLHARGMHRALLVYWPFSIIRPPSFSFSHNTRTLRTPSPRYKLACGRLAHAVLCPGLKRHTSVAHPHSRVCAAVVHTS